MSHDVSANLAIQQLNARYADAIHRRDADAWSSLWAEDASWNIFDQTFEGRETILATWLGAMEGFPFVYHQCHAGVINVEGDRAKCRWYINEEIIDAQQQALRFVGVYNDVCSRSGDQWLYQHRRFDVIYQGPGALSPEGSLPYPEDIKHAI